METTINTAYAAAYNFVSLLNEWALANESEGRIDLDWDAIVESAEDAGLAFEGIIPSPLLSDVLDVAGMIRTGEEADIQASFVWAISMINADDQIMEELATITCKA